LSYITAILKALFEFSQIEFTGEYDNNKISGNVLFCAVGNGRSIGGGLYLMPNAKVDDNVLDLSVVTIKSRFKLLTLLPKAISNSLSSRKELVQHRFNNLDLELIIPFYAHIDGEIITDKAKSISISIAENKLNFICKGKDVFQEN
jgi:diacylglycerol kinase (ATP)